MAYIEEVLRKGIHFGSIVIPAAAVILPRTEIVLILTAAALALVLIDLLRSRNRVFRRFFLGLVRQGDAGQRAGRRHDRFHGSRGKRRPNHTSFQNGNSGVSLVFLSVGDSAAALMGRKFGRTPLVSGRTLEGSLSALLSCLLVSIPLMHLSAAQGWKLSPTGLLAGALAATLAELFEVPLDDNLRIPVFAGLVMELVVPG